ncbi:hypothetical protein NDU88_001774 [Pleurodeles waltl]|uniref:RPA-related protein RADX n=1 Tax=Pleurodeles waltl TaxID=8319 RepID=A0AAV7V8R2_PLEWA|nr:hypothetical protein NDU88_001774 [Pleurodeles waltl]
MEIGVPERVREAADNDIGPEGTTPRPNSWLERTFLKVTTSPTLKLTIEDHQPVVIIAVERYLATVCTSENTTPAVSLAPRDNFCYDLTISDGVYQEKWHLDTGLNFLVQRNILKCGTEVNITKCSYIYDERRIGWGFMCIEELVCGNDGLTPKTLPCREHEKKKDPNLPLTGGMKHYLSLWNNEDPYGDIWIQNKVPDDQLNFNTFKMVSLSDLEMSWRNRKSFPPLLVKIMHKSRLLYFGKTRRKPDVPYQACFEVADQSGMMPLILWNSLCFEWFQSLRVGTVILLRQYVVKLSYPSRTRPVSRNTQMNMFTTIELGLNSLKPSAVINIVPDKQVKAEWKLPDVKYNFITRSELDSLPHNHSCDVIGLVTFVGRSQRKRKRSRPGFPDDCEGFWLYRWVQAVDGTSEQPFVLELFASSQPDIFENIHPMSYLVCTQMKLVRDSASTTTAYLTTTNESQIFITGFHKGQPYITNEKVKRFIRWTKTQTEAELLEKSAIGGYYHFPLAPDTFSLYNKDSKDEISFSTFGELKREIEELQYREHRRITVQGIIAAIQCISDDHTAKEVPGTEPVEEGELSSTPYETAESGGSPSVLSKARIQGEARRGQDERDRLALSAPESSQEQGLRNPSKRKKTRRDSNAQHDNPVSSKERPFDKESIEDVSQFSEPDEQRTNKSLDEREADEGKWESELWSDVNLNLIEHLKYCPLLPESIPRQFDYRYKEFLMQQFNVQPAKLKAKNYQSDEAVDKFKAASSLGYYILTIQDLNHRVAIDVAYFPVDATHPQDGVLRPRNPAGQSNTNCMKRMLQRFPLPGKTVKSVHDLNRLHLIFILDICNLGGDRVEVCLNRMYNPAEEINVEK